MKKSSGLKVLVIGIVLVVLVVGYYYYLSNVKEREEEHVTATRVQEVLLRDLTKNYPPTPKEVVKYYAQITQCLHNEIYTDEEFAAMAEKLYALYDEALAQENPWEKNMSDLEYDISSMQAKEYKISSYALVNSTDVEFFIKDGYECAGVNCTYTLRLGSQLGYSDILYILRKDEDGHWKIYGWELDR